MEFDIWADFNSMLPDNRVKTLRKFAREGLDLHLGMTLIVGNDDGLVYKGSITGITDAGVVELEIVRESVQHVAG